MEHSEGEESGVASLSPVPLLRQIAEKAGTGSCGKSRESPVRAHAPKPPPSVVQVRSRAVHWPVWVGSKQISHAVR